MFILLSCHFDKKFTGKSNFYKALFENQPTFVS